MYIRAFDEDPVDDDHLDNIFINMELSESSNFTAVQEFTGEMNKVTVSMTFRVMCQENFYGTNCATFCVAQNDDQNGHYTCNGDGSIQCLPGFENTINNCTDGEYYMDVIVRILDLIQKAMIMVWLARPFPLSYHIMLKASSWPDHCPTSCIE